MKKIHLLHTNDIHSHFEYWPQIHRYLVNERKRLEANEEAVFIFDIGDHVDRSHAFTEGTAGKGNVQLLNQAGYDAITIGNNEGITMSKNALNALYQEAHFDVLLCNLKEHKGQAPAWITPSKVCQTKDGVKIGIVGATAYYEDFYQVLGWEIQAPKQQIMEEVANLKKQCDVIICLSHLGIHEDRKLAEACPTIDVILGAHTHHVLPEGEFVGDTLLAATGKFGDFIGHVTIEYSNEDPKRKVKKARLIQSASLPLDQTDKIALDSTLSEGKSILQEPVFYNPMHMRQNLFGDSALASFFGRALLQFTEADCALFNAGIFLGSLPKGWVTREDVHRLLPHPINVCTIELTGEQLFTIYEQSQDEALAHIKVRGLGFRGTIMGKLIHERLYQNRKGKLFVGNREVVATDHYRLATLDMFTFGFFFPLFQELKKEYYMPDLIRDVFIQYGQQE